MLQTSQGGAWGGGQGWGMWAESQLGFGLGACHGIVPWMEWGGHLGRGWSVGQGTRDASKEVWREQSRGRRDPGGLKGRDPAGAGAGGRAVGTQPQRPGPKAQPSALCS